MCVCICIYFCTYLYTYVYIYICLPPLKPTGFDLFIVFYVDFLLFFCLRKQAAIFH